MNNIHSTALDYCNTASTQLSLFVSDAIKCVVMGATGARGQSIVSHVVSHVVVVSL